MSRNYLEKTNLNLVNYRIRSLASKTIFFDKTLFSWKPISNAIFLVHLTYNFLLGRVFIKYGNAL